MHKSINLNENNNKPIDINFIGIHENHHISLKEDISIKEIKTEKEKYDLAKKLLRNNLTIPFPFPIQTFKLIKFYYQKQKSKIFYDNF